ncbi:MAG: MBL fold metallo-hydrolase [Myxococcota bacterium]
MPYDLPGPGPDQLVMYVLGPGFGESVLIATPGGSWIVVDSCRHNGRCLPLEFLRERGVTDVALVVVTHADLDHIDGLDELLAGVAVRRLVRFPRADSLPALLANARDREDRRLRALHAALASIDAFEDRNHAVEATYDTQSLQIDEVEFKPISPLEADRSAARRQIQAILNGPALSEPVEAWLTGEERRVPGAWNNGLSVALAIRWADVRILLPADLEAVGGEFRGWRGLLARLDEDGLLELVQDLHLVKVAHHGSEGAWHDDAWARHGRVRVAAITPWNRGRSGLPSEDVIKRLKNHAEILALSHEDPKVRSRREPHWSSPACSPRRGDPAVAITIARDGAIEVHTAGTAGAWKR